jgi:hypothetical protein
MSVFVPCRRGAYYGFPRAGTQAFVPFVALDREQLEAERYFWRCSPHASFLDVSPNRWVFICQTLRQVPRKSHRSGNRWDTGRQDTSTYPVVAREGSHEGI